VFIACSSSSPPSSSALVAGVGAALRLPLVSNDIQTDDAAGGVCNSPSTPREASAAWTSPVEFPGLGFELPAGASATAARISGSSVLQRLHIPKRELRPTTWE
jgi:hypothetical protein